MTDGRTDRRTKRLIGARATALPKNVLWDWTNQFSREGGQKNFLAGVVKNIRGRGEGGKQIFSLGTNQFFGVCGAYTNFGW